MKLKNLFASAGHSEESLETSCCGQHEVCEKEELLKTFRKNIEYYDDEELDAYKNRSSDSYSPEEIDVFAHILQTMWESDVPGWIRSLQLREIELPDALKDEVFCMLNATKH